MTDFTDVDDSVVFREYDKRVHDYAGVIANELENLNKREVLNGCEWCEENGVPENVFSDAVSWYLENVTWGVSVMYPFRNEDEVVVKGFEQEKTEGEDVEDED